MYFIARLIVKNITEALMIMYVKLRSLKSLGIHFDLDNMKFGCSTIILYCK